MIHAAWKDVTYCDIAGGEKRQNHIKHHKTTRCCWFLLSFLRFSSRGTAGLRPVQHGARLEPHLLRASKVHRKFGPSRVTAPAIEPANLWRNKRRRKNHRISPCNMDKIWIKYDKMATVTTVVVVETVKFCWLLTSNHPCSHWSYHLLTFVGDISCKIVVVELVQAPTQHPSFLGEVLYRITQFRFAEVFPVFVCKTPLSMQKPWHLLVRTPLNLNTRP